MREFYTSTDGRSSKHSAIAASISNAQFPTRSRYLKNFDVESLPFEDRDEDSDSRGDGSLFALRHRGLCGSLSPGRASRRFRRS